MSAKTLAAGLAAALTLTLLAFSPALPSRPAHAAVIDPAAWYQLINRNSGKALHVRRSILTAWSVHPSVLIVVQLFQ